MTTTKSSNNNWWFRMKPSPVKANSLDGSNKGTIEFNWKCLFCGLLHVYTSKID